MICLEDPFLHLNGPSHAIMFMNKFCIEIELRVKGLERFQDKDMISCAHCCTEGDGPGVSTFYFKNVLCTLELCLEPVKKKQPRPLYWVSMLSKTVGHGLSNRVASLLSPHNEGNLC
jgi:hypothetical protein